ncbi:ATP-binding protein [Candidatus Gracilibacteria bacterium]|nr:ATP-binding protein [Candidatus Gracilibacteria bacterium]
MNTRNIVLLLGARQVGKTTILKNLQKDASASSATYFLNLENPSIVAQLNEHPENLFMVTGSQSHTKQIIFIDEIQYLENPTNFLKYIYDEYAPNVKLVVSGSSSFYIDKKFKDSLIGRKKVFSIYTLDFFEFLRFKGESSLVDTLYQQKKIPVLYEQKVWQYFREYVTYGGYPEIVLLDSAEAKIDRLQDYSFDYIKKDIYEANIQHEDKFLALLKILASQTGELVNTNELANTLSLTAPTVEKYLYVMQKSFHISLMKPFHSNIRKELIKMPKVYFLDLGMRNVLLNNFESITDRFDKGPYLENIVFRELLFSTARIDEIQFWRTQNMHEVDFVLESQKKAYEVKFSASQIKKNKYTLFQTTYPSISFGFLTYEQVIDTLIL